MTTALFRISLLRNEPYSLTNNKLDYNTFSQLAKLIPKMRFERVSLRFDTKYLFIFTIHTFVLSCIVSKSNHFQLREGQKIKQHVLLRPALNGGRKYTVQFRNLCSKYLEKC